MQYGEITLLKRGKQIVINSDFKETMKELHKDDKKNVMLIVPVLELCVIPKLLKITKYFSEYLKVIICNDIQVDLDENMFDIPICSNVIGGDKGFISISSPQTSFDSQIILMRDNKHGIIPRNMVNNKLHIIKFNDKKVGNMSLYNSDVEIVTPPINDFEINDISKIIKNITLNMKPKSIKLITNAVYDSMLLDDLLNNKLITGIKASFNYTDIENGKLI